MEEYRNKVSKLHATYSMITSKFTTKRPPPILGGAIGATLGGKAPWVGEPLVLSGHPWLTLQDRTTFGGWPKAHLWENTLSRGWLANIS